MNEWGWVPGERVYKFVRVWEGALRTSVRTNSLSAYVLCTTCAKDYIACLSLTFFNLKNEWLGIVFLISSLVLSSLPLLRTIIVESPCSPFKAHKPSKLFSSLLFSLLLHPAAPFPPVSPLTLLLTLCWRTGKEGVGLLSKLVIAS